MIVLRDDQETAVSDIRTAMRTHRSVMFQAQTGFGKTVVAAYIAKRAHERQQRVVFGVHRKELMRQTIRTFDAFNIPHGMIGAGFNGNPFEPIQIASADTIRNRESHWRCSLFVADEAHLWAADTRARTIQGVKATGGRVLGLSATPKRLDGRPLRGLFDTMVSGPSVAWLMEQGFLSRYRAFAPTVADFSGLHTRMGEYVTAELDEKFNKPQVVGDAPSAWKKYARGLRTMAFAFSRKHGAALTEAYNAAGIPAVYVDGETKDGDRRSRIMDFADGRAMVLVSVDLCIEGFDLSSQVGRDVPVEAVALLRPTQSLPRARQMIGRGLRPKARPAIIMDHVNMLATHGLPDDEIEWTLDGADRRKSAPGVASVPLTICRSCFFTGRPFSACPSCGAVVETGGRVVREIDGEISELDIEAIRRERDLKHDRWREQDAAKDLPSLMKVGKKYGIKNPLYWAKHVLNARKRKAA